MSRGGIGSASIVLVFAVLCLTIFTVISLSSALTEQSLIDLEVRTVQAFYQADVLAEKILAEILQAPATPDNILGVDIYADWDWDYFAERVFFAVPISDTTDLYVEVLIEEDAYTILTWRMQQFGDWEVDDILNLWTGFD